MAAAKKGTNHEQEVEAAITSLRETHLNKVIESGLVDTLSTVSVLVDTLYAQPTTPPSLYIDLEGVYLSREGTVSILQVYVLPLGRAYLLDVHTLKDAAFLTPGTNGRTLKDLLESSAIPKVFFDVRNDSDSLFFHFKINLAGVQDLQLMELASRTYSRKYVAGLAKCIDRDGNLSPVKGAKWKATKEKGLKMFMPESGGSYEVFNERPLSEEIRQYCTQDVQFLPQLWALYRSRLSQPWRNRVLLASKERVLLSQSRGYISHGQHMALAPESWAKLI